MGIRFLCPQGHPLHVKAFLAGKKGVCPDCGARVRIPFESLIHKDGSPIDPDTVARKDGDDEDAHEIPPETPAMKSGEDLREAAPIPQGTAPPQMQAPVATPAAVRPVAVVAAAVPTGQPVAVAPTAVPVAPVPVAAVPVAGASGMPAPVAVAAVGVSPSVGVVRAVTPVGGPELGQAVVGGGVAIPVAPRPVMAVGSPVPPGLVDPITEAPTAVWYVRPAGGGQYGPARGDAFRQWLNQGRVANDSLVWREGWADWKAAAAVFPELAGTASLIGGAVPGGGAAGGLAAVSAASTTATYKNRRQSSTTVGIVLLILLGVICLALIGVLVFVLPKA